MAGDWALITEAGEFAFGGDATGYPLAGQPVVDLHNADQARTPQPRRDGVLPGVDYLRGMTVSSTLRIREANATAALAASGPLVSAWRADAERGVAGAVAELRAPSGRSVIGRPDPRVSFNDDALHIGRRTALASFEAISSLWYGPEWTAEVALIPAESGGFVAPFVFPLSTTGHAERASLFTVGGDTPTDHLILEVDGGAILNPVLEVVGVARFELGLSMAYDGQLQLDGRPWVTTTLLSGGSVAGTRSRQSTPLSRFRIPPGQHELVLRGQSAGNPRLRLRGRDAYTTR